MVHPYSSIGKRNCCTNNFLFIIEKIGGQKGEAHWTKILNSACQGQVWTKPVPHLLVTWFCTSHQGQMGALLCLFKPIFDPKPCYLYRMQIPFHPSWEKGHFTTSFSLDNPGLQDFYFSKWLRGLWVNGNVGHSLPFFPSPPPPAPTCVGCRRC